MLVARAPSGQGQHPGHQITLVADSTVVHLRAGLAGLDQLADALEQVPPLEAQRRPETGAAGLASRHVAEPILDLLSEFARHVPRASSAQGVAIVVSPRWCQQEEPTDRDEHRQKEGYDVGQHDPMG